MEGGRLPAASAQLAGFTTDFAPKQSSYDTMMTPLEPKMNPNPQLKFLPR
jgi:hypothetical protein